MAAATPDTKGGDVAKEAKTPPLEQTQQRVTRSSAAKAAGASPTLSSAGGGRKGSSGSAASSRASKGKKGATRPAVRQVVRVPDLTAWRKAQALYPVIVGPEPKA